MKPKNLLKVIAAVILLVFALKYFMLQNGMSISYFTFTRIDQILIGSVLAIMENNNSLTKKQSRLFIITGLCIFPIAVVIYIIAPYFYFIKEMMKYSLLALFFFSIIGFLLTKKETFIVNKLLESEALQYLGKISYGIYVWHILAIFILNKFLILKNVYLDLALTIILSIALAHLSYFYFEAYFLRLKDKSPKRISQQIKKKLGLVVVD